MAPYGATFWEWLAIYFHYGVYTAGPEWGFFRVPHISITISLSYRLPDVAPKKFMKNTSSMPIRFTNLQQPLNQPTKPPTN